MAAQNNALVKSQQWYADSEANAHVTFELENLSIQQPFTGHDTVVVGNGSGLHIQHIGSTYLRTPQSNFLLTRVLHCPNVAKNLLSINRFCIDNDCFFILTSSNFVV